MKFHSLHHVPFEGPGMIQDYVEFIQGHLEQTQVYEPGATLPNEHPYDVLVVMGGPMSVGDSAEHPWLVDEKRYLAEAVAAGKKIIGVCLGAQLLAEVLGGEVKPNGQQEIGWFPIGWQPGFLNGSLGRGLNETSDVFHWHGDTFSIPEGAELIASSQACVNQGFNYQDQVLGLQFHLEMAEPHISKIIDACYSDVEQGPAVMSAEDMLQQAAIKSAATRSMLFKLLDNWLGQ